MLISVRNACMAVSELTQVANQTSYHIEARCYIDAPRNITRACPSSLHAQQARMMHAPPGLSPRVRECERGVCFPKPHTFCSRGSATHAAFPAAEERNLPVLPAALIAPICACVHIAPRGGHSYR
ncbi:hypothetical protein C8R44DRAFT_172397 [Mycena epipterygia]|nr:hypothetical protein C8R44DRAFT_172397 [Mycena epipterygia]